MKKRDVKVVVGTGTVQEFFKRAHEDAGKMDRENSCRRKFG